MSFKINIFVFFLCISFSLTLNTHRRTTHRNLRKLANFLSNKGTCDIGMGKTGKCYSAQAYISQSLPAGNIKDSFDQIIYPIISNFGTLPSFCFGDFLGSDFNGGIDDLSNALCSTIPLNPSSTYGGVSLFGPALPCASGETAACLVFDQCGTFALSISGGAVACVASRTGFGNILRLADDILQHVMIGFSWNGRFFLEVEVPILSSTNVVSFKNIGINAHLVLSVGAAFPMNMTKAGRKVKELIEISGSFDRFVYFSVPSSLDSLIVSIKSNPVKTAIESAIDSVTGSAGVDGYKITGSISFLLADLTSNFLQDFVFNLPVIYIVMAGTNSFGLDEGIYLSVVYYVGDELASALTGMVAHFEGIFDALGFSAFSFSGLSKLQAKLGIWIGVLKAGFSIEVTGFTLHCLFDLTGMMGSCNRNNVFFTAVLEGAVWVFKKATAFFSKTGDEIARISKTTAQYSKTIVKSGTKAVKKVACKISSALFGTKCKKNSNPSFKPGDGSIFRFKKDDDNDKQLGVSTDCATEDSLSTCVLTLEKNTATNVWRQLWEYTGDHKICNVMIDNNMYGDQSVDQNKKCITGDGGWKNVYLETYAKAIAFEIKKEDNHRFTFSTCDKGTRSNCKNASPKYAIYFMNADGSYTSLNSHSNFEDFDYTVVDDY